MLVLCIESSCDETSAAVIRDGSEMLSNVVASQVDVHSRFGGVVPELASRKHVEAISVVINSALEEAGVTVDQLEGIGVTRGPGLIGALLVGLSTAKAMAWSLNIPLAAVHHMEGHILAPMLEDPPDFPFLALAVSGGHTHLYRVDGIGRYKTLGQTLDDAAGEAQVKTYIKYMKPSTPVSTGPFKESMVEMKLEALTLQQLVGYLYLIESPGDLVSIKRLSVNENKKEEGYLDAIVQVLTFQQAL